MPGQSADGVKRRPLMSSICGRPLTEVRSLPVCFAATQRSREAAIPIRARQAGGECVALGLMLISISKARHSGMEFDPASQRQGERNKGKFGL